MDPEFLMLQPEPIYNPHYGNGVPLMFTMAIGVVEFSREGYKIRKVFA